MREEIYDGKIVTLALLDGKWEIVEHPGSVGVLIARELAEEARSHG